MPYISSAKKFTFTDALRALWKKTWKLTAKYFPLNRIRVFALRRAGYSVGESVYVGEELHITDILETRECMLSIGDRVAIAQRVTIILASDPNWSRLAEKIPPVRGTVQIENDAWIGAGAIILPNVVIGEGAIVGAGSVVTKNVEPWTIVAGCPAKFIREV